MTLFFSPLNKGRRDCLVHSNLGRRQRAGGSAPSAGAEAPPWLVSTMIMGQFVLRGARVATGEAEHKPAGSFDQEQRLKQAVEYYRLQVCQCCYGGVVVVET